jgi:hypothetical protein
MTAAARPARRTRISANTLHALMSAATRQLLNEPADSPRRRPSLPVLKFMREEAPDEPRADAAARKEGRS